MFCLIAAATALGSCARDKVIPDEELARIFRDAYLINAYVSDRGVKLDSLELTNRFSAVTVTRPKMSRYTIGNFSRAKRQAERRGRTIHPAARRGERLLQVRSRRTRYDRQRGRRRFTRTVYSDSLIRVTRIKDTARLRVRIPDTRPGEYRVSFDYLIDSLDENLAPRMRVWLVEADSSRKGESSSILRKSSRERVSRILQADSSARSLVLSLYGTREKFGRPT